MREFIYFSSKARTSGNFTDLMKAGRMDIVCNVIIQALYLSNSVREDVHLHLIFNGMPNPPMHLEFITTEKEIPISKKDVAGLIKRMLYKCKGDKGKKTEIFPGCFIEKKSFEELLKESEQMGKKIFVMGPKGENIRKLSRKETDNCVFVIGDHEGLPKKEIKKYKNQTVSVGKRTYLASQIFVITHNELDLREES